MLAELAAKSRNAGLIVQAPYYGNKPCEWIILGPAVSSTSSSDIRSGDMSIFFDKFNVGAEGDLTVYDCAQPSCATVRKLVSLTDLGTSTSFSSAMGYGLKIRLTPGIAHKTMRTGFLATYCPASLAPCSTLPTSNSPGHVPETTKQDATALRGAQESPIPSYHKGQGKETPPSTGKHPYKVFKIERNADSRSCLPGRGERTTSNHYETQRESS